MLDRYEVRHRALRSLGRDLTATKKWRDAKRSSWVAIGFDDVLPP